MGGIIVNSIVITGFRISFTNADPVISSASWIPFLPKNRLLFVAVMCDNIGYIIVEVCVMAIVQWQVNLLLILLLHWYTNFFCSKQFL